MCYFSFGAPSTADNDVKGDDGGFVFHIEILGCQVKTNLVAVTSVL